MAEKQMAQLLRKKIYIWLISRIDLPDFLLKEVQELLQNLNYAKLKKIEQQKEELLELVLKIKQDYHQKLLNIFIYFLIKNGYFSFSHSQKRVSRYFVMA